MTKIPLSLHNNDSTPIIFLDSSINSTNLKLTSDVSQKLSPYLGKFVSAQCSKTNRLRKRDSKSQCTLSHNCLLPLAIQALKDLASLGRDYWGSVSPHPLILPSPISETVDAATGQDVLDLWGFLEQPAQLHTIAQGVVLTLENYLVSPPDLSLGENKIIFSSLPCADEQTPATPSSTSCPSATVVDVQGTRSVIVGTLLFSSLATAKHQQPIPCGISECRPKGPNSEGQYGAGLCDKVSRMIRSYIQGWNLVG